MNIIEDKEKVVYRNEINGKISYSIGISKKKEDGTYENGYIPVRFKKDVSLENKTKIKIKQGWIDFFKIEKKTFIYIFINEFDEVETQQSNTTTQQNDDIWNAGKNIEIPEEELPFY